ncbi:hypothetical protein COX86_03245 [Candidatus Micrarchaeota archaeon CG_4_10_14_0_2_um_filter_60_11]|nr:MAG: hypothetical protein COX86_03245 [Candidatus Micrarchaeota archaeon CG_4_10_14_0_2_um_filter_60_11]
MDCLQRIIGARNKKACEKAALACAAQKLGTRQAFHLDYAPVEGLRLRLADDATLRLLKGNLDWLKLRASHSLHRGLTVTHLRGYAIALAPLRKRNGKPLGVIGAIKKKFEKGDLEALSQIAAAAETRIELARANARLAVEEKELALEGELQRVLSSNAGFRESLELFAFKLAQYADARETAFYSYSEKSGELVLTAGTDAAQRAFASLSHAASTAGKKGCPVSEDGTVAAPIELNGEAVGAVAGVAHGNEAIAKRLFKVAAIHAASIYSLEKQRLRLEGTLRKVVSPGVHEDLLEYGAHLGGERKIVTVLFTDLRGFTKISEEQDASDLVARLNEHFEAITRPVLAHGGIIEGFMGDGMMAFFGARGDGDNHEEEALKAALEMQSALDALNARWAVEDRKVEFKMGIGVNTGDAIVGNMGSSDYLHYTAIGDTTNTASRICGIAKGGEILASEATVKPIKEDLKLREREPVELKGKRKPVRVYDIRGFR